MLKNSYASCLGLSPAISSQLTLEVCTTAEKFAKNPTFGGSRSFKIINVDKTKKLVSSACHDKQLVCTYPQPFSHYKSQQQQNNVFF